MTRSGLPKKLFLECIDSHGNPRLAPSPLQIYYVDGRKSYETIRFELWELLGQVNSYRPNNPLTIVGYTLSGTTRDSFRKFLTPINNHGKGW